MKRAMVWVLAVALVAAAGIGWRLTMHRDPTRFSAVFTNTVGLYKGSDVRILGLPVGTVTGIHPQGTSVRVDMEMDADQKVAPDTGAVIIAPTLVSDRYVQLTEPWESGRSLATGATIPEDKTATPVEVDELYKSLTDLTKALGPDGANKDGSLSRLIEVGAQDLDGNGKRINRTLRDFGRLTGTLSKSDDDFFATVDNFAQFNRVLADNDRGVAQVNSQLAQVSGFLADDRQDLVVAEQQLNEALAVIDDFIRDNRASLTRSVSNLVGPTQTLVRQRDSLEDAVRTLPLALQNFLRTYKGDGGDDLLRTRLNLNELTVWARGQAQQQAQSQRQQQAGSQKQAAPAGQKSAATGEQSSPPLLLPGDGAR